MNKTINEEKIQDVYEGVDVLGIQIEYHVVKNIHDVHMGEFASMSDIPMYMKGLIEEGFATVETKTETI